MRRAVLLILLAGCRDWEALSERRTCSGPPTRCSGAGLCDGFEDEIDPRWDVVDSRTSVGRSADCAYRGEAALAVDVDRLAIGDTARGDLTTDQVPAAELYLRLFVRLPPQLPSHPIKLAKVSDPAAPLDGLVLRVEGGALVVNNTRVQDEARSAASLEPDAWACLELQFAEGTPGRYRVWLDDVLVPELDRNEDTAPIGRLNVGVIGYDATEPDDPYRLYIDEVAVAASRVGCDG